MNRRPWAYESCFDHRTPIHLKYKFILRGETTIPALWIKQGSLTLPTKAPALGAPIGLMMALGSICFVLSLAKLPVGMATAISASYVLLVLFLSWIFLDESMSWMKIAGTLLTIGGVALLSWEQK